MKAERRRGRFLAAKNGARAAMSPIVKTVVLLTASNVFMTIAWYGHLKSLKDKALWIAILASWGIAFFEYCLQVPANRVGKQEAGLALGQLKILQEVITLGVFVPYAVLVMKEKLSLDFLWAGLCLVGAVYFVFRSKSGS